MNADAELVRDTVERRRVDCRDASIIRDARSLALQLLGPHALGGYRIEGDSLRRDSVHEAGHALVALVTSGASFETASIRPRAVVRCVRYRTSRERIVGDMGGAVAELLVFGDLVPEGCTADFQNALSLADGALDEVRAAAARADRILREGREELDTLAITLLVAGELTFDESLSFVGRLW